MEQRKVKSIKSNVANSFNGRDPNLSIYLEGVSIEQEFGRRKVNWRSAVTSAQTRLVRRFNLWGILERNLSCHCCYSPMVEFLQRGITKNYAWNYVLWYRLMNFTFGITRRLDNRSLNYRVCIWKPVCVTFSARQTRHDAHD